MKQNQLVASESQGFNGSQNRFGALEKIGDQHRDAPPLQKMLQREEGLREVCSMARLNRFNGM